MTLVDFERILQLLALGAAAAAVLALFARGLHRSYPWFFALLFVDFVFGVIGQSIPPNTTRYAEFYMLTSALGAVINYKMLSELLRFVLSGQPGIARFARNATHVLLTLGVLLSLTLLLLQPQPSRFRFPVLALFFAIHQTVQLVLAVLLLGVALLLMRYPLRLSRNVVSYAIGITAIFASEALLLVLHNRVVGLSFGAFLSVVHLAIAVVCRVYWALAFTREGEAVEAAPVAPGPGAEALLAELRSLNAILAPPKSGSLR